MGIPIYDPRDDYDYVPVRRRQPEAPEHSPERKLDPDRAGNAPSQNEAERDERSPIQRRLESLAQRAADRRVISSEHLRRERTVRHEQPREERKRERNHAPDTEPRIGRDRQPQIAVDLRLRPEEIRTLSEFGRFRVIGTRDLADTIYHGNSGQMERDLSFLREKNLVSTDFINARRDGRNQPVERIQVVTLTPEGKSLLRETGQVRGDQEIYSGLVKLREVEHDSQVYRAYLKEWERIEKEGGNNPRVVLDFELKSDIQKAIHAQQKAEPDEDLSAIKQQVAEEFDLKFIDDSIQIPDLRIEYDLDQGARSGHSDVEVVTAAIAQQFLLKAKSKGHIDVLDFGQQRHVYHLFYKPFYRFLDNPDSQNRRRKSDAEIKLRLMALDYVLLHLADSFLETREAKVQFFTESLRVATKDLPQSGRYSRQSFADRILISYEKEEKTPCFVFIEEGTRTLVRFEKFLSDYKRLFTALSRFELVYVADANVNLAEAGHLFEKLFPQAHAANTHALYPKGSEHLLDWFRVRARYDAELGGLSMQDFLLLREGNLLYTAAEHKKLYEQWRIKRFSAGEIPQRLGAKSSSVSFRTELLELSYPIFTYRHLPSKPPSFYSIDRSQARSA